jgi:7-cyano-7-deazaguanine synthase in queuosine biosynthesis
MNRVEHSSFQVPAARIVLGYNSSPSRGSEIRCTVERDLVIKPERLGRYCVRPLEPRIYDLVLIAGAVAFADRVVQRKTRTCWRRELEVVVPTSDPDFWKQTVVVKNLIETLQLLTGDLWIFHFGRTRRKPNIGAQTSLPFEGRRCVVIPFSDGLDSFAAARLALQHEPNIGVIKVTTGSGPDARGSSEQHQVSIPFSRRGSRIRLRETSYRSRGFVFGVMAGIAANLLEADRIIIPESGQSALGPWLNPVGNEAPDVRTHPFFTASLSRFLKAVFDRPIRYEHPQLWKTKGETMRELKDSGLAEDWWTTRSCPRGRKVCLNGRRVQCGVCANCLLRRQSLLAAGLDEGRDEYFWPNLHAPTLRQASGPNARDTGANDERQAKCGAFDLNTLGNLLRTAFGDSRISNASAELAAHEGAPPEDVERKLRRLLVAHRDEWRAFVAAQESESFLNKWMEILQC